MPMGSGHSNLSTILLHVLRVKPGGVGVQGHSELPDVSAQAFHPSAQEAEVGGSLTWKPLWTTQDTVSKQ